MLKNIFHAHVFITVALLVLALLVVPPALAVTYTVNSTADLPDDGSMCNTAANPCTLRAAVQKANKSTEGITIILPSGIYNLSIPAAGADGEESGDLNLTTPANPTASITIVGAGSNTTIIDAGQIDRVLYVHSNRFAAISGVTIRNGYLTGNYPYGAGIYNAGLLTVNNAVISGNYTISWGAGIYNAGALTVTNTTISHNIAYQTGGGISNGGTLTVRNSTIDQNNTFTGGGGGIHNLNGNIVVTSSTIGNNSSTDGGGISQVGGLTTIVNSTISGNKAITDGGGIWIGDGTIDIYNATITQNHADYDRDMVGGGGGINAFTGLGLYGTANLHNTLVAGNDVADYPLFPDDCKGTINSYGFNLFWDVYGCMINNIGYGNWNYLNSLSTIGPLQNNGGPTWTHALLQGSNAIDGGNTFGCTGPDSSLLATDQRGGWRWMGEYCDIGAFEYGAKVPWLYLPFIIRN